MDGGYFKDKEGFSQFYVANIIKCTSIFIECKK